MRSDLSHCTEWNESIKNCWVQCVTLASASAQNWSDLSQCTEWNKSIKNCWVQCVTLKTPVLVEQQSDIALSLLLIICVSLLFLHLFTSLVLTTALFSWHNHNLSFLSPWVVCEDHGSYQLCWLLCIHTYIRTHTHTHTHTNKHTWLHTHTDWESA